MRRGTFIVIEGTDGSGKGTQFKLLRERLQAAGYDVETFDFPQYDEPSSYFVRQYLNGKYGNSQEIGPYTASLFYALDRYEASSKIREALDKGKIVLSNRFTGSSMGHQGAKFRNAEERRGYFIWLDHLEFEMLRIPRPDANFVLRVPADIADELIDKKEQRAYTTKKRDIHESDLKHLEQSVAVYDDMCQLFPKDFQRIDCVRNDKLLDVETVQHLLWEKVSPLLPQPPQLEMPMPATTSAVSATPAASTTLKVHHEDAGTPSDNKHTGQPTGGAKPEKKNGDTSPPAATKQDPEKQEFITNRNGDVYAFTDALEPPLIAAVMATLGHSSGVLSTTVLKAFGEAAHKDNTFLKRVLDTYADASVRRLVHRQVIITGASALLVAKLERGRQGVYTEPQVQFIRPESKDADDNYKYFKPSALAKSAADYYTDHLDYIYDAYTSLHARLVDYLQNGSSTPQDGRNAEWKTAIDTEARIALQGIVPLANTSTVGMYASAEAFEHLIIRLLSDELSEARYTGERILEELRKTIPHFMEDADKPQTGGSEIVFRANTAKRMAEFAENYIKETHGSPTKAVQLTDVWPRSEFDLLPDMLYSVTNMPLRAIVELTGTWPYERRERTFTAYLGERLCRRDLPGRALEKARYSWDMLTSFMVFRDLQRQNVADNLEWQLLTPRHGFDIPPLIEKAGLTDEYEDCFDTSLQIHSMLHGAGYPLEAQYATLAGHKMRWMFTHTARQAIRFMEQHTSQRTAPETRHVVEEMHERLGEVHPYIAEIMEFVGQPDDAELRALAADRYNTYKQEQI